MYMSFCLSFYCLWFNVIVRWFCTSPRQFDHWSAPLLILYVPFIKMKMLHTRERERERERESVHTLGFVLENMHEREGLTELGGGPSSERNEVHSPQQHQSQTSLLLPLRALVLGFDLTKLLTVGQYQVHVPVKCQERPNKHPAIQQSDAHAVLQVLAQLPLARLQK